MNGNSLKLKKIIGQVSICLSSLYVFCVLFVEVSCKEDDIREMTSLIENL